MLTQKDIDEIEEIVGRQIDEKTRLLPTKDDFFTKMDEVMGELKTLREEQTVISGYIEDKWAKIEMYLRLIRFTHYKDQLEDHETRITKLEEPTPA